MTTVTSGHTRPLCEVDGRVHHNEHLTCATDSYHGNQKNISLPLKAVTPPHTKSDNHFVLLLQIAGIKSPIHSVYKQMTWKKVLEDSNDLQNRY